MCVVILSRSMLFYLIFFKTCLNLLQLIKKRNHLKVKFLHFETSKDNKNIVNANFRVYKDH